MKIIRLLNAAINLIYTTDWHLAAQAPGRRRDNYAEAIFKKLQFVRDLAVRLKGVALCGADVFHVKNPKSPSNSFGLLIRLIHLLRTFPLGFIVGNVGNHDLSWDRMDSLPHQPLGLLIATGVYHNLVDEPVLFVNEDESVKVLVESFPYANEEITQERLLACGPRPEGVTYRIALVHAYGRPGNSGTDQMFGSFTIGYNNLQDLDYDFILWGHDHSRKETVTVGNVTHINLGSLARAALATDEVDRPVVATILSFAADGVRVKEKKIPVDPLEIAFTMADKAVENVAKSDEVSEFFASMDEQVGGIESNDPFEVLKQLCPENEPQLLQLARELCEG